MAYITREKMTKIVLGLLLGLVIGAACRFFDIPVPSPPKLVGALLVVAMTVGYSVTDRYFARDAATTAHLCGGPTGETVAKNNLRGASADVADVRP
jgi:XapX domain-containing protein